MRDGPTIFVGDAHKRLRRGRQRWPRRLARLALVALAALGLSSGVEAAHERTRRSQALVDLAHLADGARLFRLEQQRCPRELAELVKPGPGRTLAELPRDPWGNAYQLRCPGLFEASDLEVLSGGPDGPRTAEDDLTSL